MNFGEIPSYQNFTDILINISLHIMMLTSLEDDY